MSEVDRLARLGLLHLADKPEQLKKELAKLAAKRKAEEDAAEEARRKALKAQK